MILPWKVDLDFDMLILLGQKQIIIFLNETSIKNRNKRAYNKNNKYIINWWKLIHDASS